MQWPIASEAFLQYMEHERRASLRTVAAYERDIRALSEFATSQGVIDVASVKTLTLRQFLAELFGTLSPVTLSRKVSAWRSFFRFLKQRGHVSANPATAIKLPKAPTRLPRFLDASEAAEVVKTPAHTAPLIARRDAAILETLYGTGVRVSELTQLDVSDVDMQARRMRVLGKGNKERIVPLGSQAHDAIFDYLNARSEFRAKGKTVESTRLFLGRYGTPLTVRQVQNIVRRSGMGGAARSDLHPHALRHSCATHMLDAGADLRAIQELLGHASLSTTQRYTHVSVDQLKKVYDTAHPLAVGEDDS